MFEPFRRCLGIVVCKNHDLALSDPDAGIARMGQSWAIFMHKAYARETC